MKYFFWRFIYDHKSLIILIQILKLESQNFLMWKKFIDSAWMGERNLISMIIEIINYFSSQVLLFFFLARDLRIPSPFLCPHLLCFQKVEISVSLNIEQRLRAKFGFWFSNFWQLKKRVFIFEIYMLRMRVMNFHHQEEPCPVQFYLSKWFSSEYFIQWKSFSSVFRHLKKNRISRESKRKRQVSF